MKLNSNYPEVVQRIHSEFFSAADELLAEAKQHMNSPVPDRLRAKVMDLEALGFTSTPEYKETIETLREADAIKAYVDQVEQYRLCYPQNRFITHERALAVCARYGLVMAPMSRFTGFVPEINLAEIKNFKVKSEHIDHLVIKGNRLISVAESETQRNLESTIRQVMLSTRRTRDPFSAMVPSGDLGTPCTPENIKPFYRICAPESDINTQGLELSANGLEYRERLIDPIVLCPVKYGYLVVTAWGDEAHDPEIKSIARN